MAGMAVDGLVSGFNTTEMIGQLMQLEAAPQTLLKGKVTKAESLVSALQGLNTKISSLKDAAAKAAAPTSWQAVTARSSATSVTVSASNAQPSALTFNVDQLATSQTSVSGAAADLAGFFDTATGGTKPSSLTLVRGQGASAKFTTIDISTVTNLAGLADAVNKADAGVSATLVNVGDGTARVQLTGKESGSAAAFDLYSGPVTAGTMSSATVVLGRTTVPNDGSHPGSTVVSAAKDALVTLWKGVAGAEQTVKSSTNTFKDVLAGVTFSVSAVESDPQKPVTVTVGRDDAALKKLGSDLVSNISTVLAEITSRTKSTTTTSADGRQVVAGGVLSGDSATRQAKQTILAAASLPVGNASPSTVGLVLAKDGTISFDESKFTAAMTSDPAAVQKVLTEVATRIEKAASSLSDPTTGSLTTKIKGQESYVKNLNAQVDNWDDRLALRRTTLERTYSSLEVSLSKVNAQANWLTSQLAQLNANNSN